MNWGALVLNLIITVIVYLLVPVILALSKKRFPQKRIKWIVIINCVVCWFLFQVLTIELSGESSTSAAVFIWGAVGYAILRKFCVEPEEQEAVETEDDTEPTKSEIKADESSLPNARPFSEISLSSPDEKATTMGDYHVRGSDIALEKADEASTCCLYAHNDEPKPEEKQAPVVDIPTKQKTGVSKPLFIVISCLCVIAIVCSCVFGYLYRKNYNIAVQNFDVVEKLEAENLELEKALAEKDDYSEKIAELEAELSRLDEANAKLRSTNESLSNRISELNEVVSINSKKAELCDEHLVFVPNGSNMYHKYDCEKWSGTGSIYASWQLDGMNLRACPYCH